MQLFYCNYIELTLFNNLISYELVKFTIALTFIKTILFTLSSLKIFITILTDVVTQSTINVLSFVSKFSF
jgi:hypothetical protein